MPQAAAEAEVAVVGTRRPAGVAAALVGAEEGAAALALKAVVAALAPAVRKRVGVPVRPHR